MDTDARKGSIAADAAILAPAPEDLAVVDAAEQKRADGPLWRRLYDDPRFLLSLTVIGFLIFFALL